MPSFAHLHVHTEYSMLDGMSRIKDLVSYTKEQGMDSVAITDHGAMYGVIEFYRACKAAEVKPIIGLEAYIAPRGRADRDPQKDRNYYHLLLLAQNQTGYQNLLKLASIAQLEGYYYKPRLDKEVLAEYSEGLICTTGCLAAEIPQMLMKGQEQAAKDLVGWYVDVFGDRFFIELQEHDIPELHQVNEALLKLQPWAQVPFLATNDVHYVRQSDADPHDVLLCIGTNSVVSEEKRMRFSGPTYYMRSPQEMWDIFGEIPDALENTLRVAEMCDVNLDDTSYKLPKFPVPEGFDAQNYLRHLCDIGLDWRYGDQAHDAQIQERLEHELRIIHEMGFDAYFLIVWDLCEYAKQVDIWWNVRGSGAGSVVAYSLGITSIDPLLNNLIFERFLNPGRETMPDIDIDYPDDRRAEMIQYCVDRYGEEKVAQIITFGTLGARAAIRDVGRALAVPLHDVDALARLIPNVPGKAVSISQALEELPEFQTVYGDKNRPDMKKLIDYARQLEGQTRHASTHAAGVLVADDDLVKYTPLNRPTSNSTGGLNTVSQWPMEIVELIGLLKVDFLGLRTLTIMRKACDLIERYHGIKYDLSTIPYRHRDGDSSENEAHDLSLDAAFRLMHEGKTSGVFQVEGEGISRTLINMKPARFEHIIAAISLFRPGPLEYIPTYIKRMHGDEPVTYHHDQLETILSETYGIIVYQEQIMQIASKLFGYNLGEADLMRRAVAKKKQDKLMKHRSIFQKEGPERGVDAETAGRIFDDIEFFARYGFNKSHAADYAVLTVQTAFLKAHYPEEYMTALLTTERGDSAKVARYIHDCRTMGIEVLPPSIHTSEHDFTIELLEDERRAIRYGLDAIKNVGQGAVEAVLQIREKKSFDNVDDFCNRVDLRAVGKRALESLVKVGALDDFADRLRLLESLERMMGLSTSQHKAADVGQISMFGEATGVELGKSSESVLVDKVSLDVKPRELLQWERELVGVYVSEHPLTRVLAEIGDTSSITFTNELTPAHNGRQVQMVGAVTYVRPHTTKTNKAMGFAGLEDVNGTIEVVIWPSTWEDTKEEWMVDRILVVKGKIDAERGDPKLLCDEVYTNLQIVKPLESELSELERLNEAAPLHTSDDAPPPDDYENYVPLPEFTPETGGTSVELPVENDYNGYELATPAYQETNGEHGNHVEPIAPIDPIPALVQTPARDESVHVEDRLRRTGDPARDRRRLGKVHGILKQNPGHDTFSIFLDDGGRTVELNFDMTTDHTQALHALEHAVDGADIQVSLA